MADYIIEIIIAIIFSAGFGTFFICRKTNDKLLSSREKGLIKEYQKEKRELSKFDIGWNVGIGFLVAFISIGWGDLTLSIAVFLFAIGFSGIRLVPVYQKTNRYFSKMGISESYLKKDSHMIYILALFNSLLGLITYLVYMYK
jgi:uncharacterized membrane protein